MEQPAPLFWPEGARPRARAWPQAALGGVLFGSVAAMLFHRWWWGAATVPAWLAAVTLHGREGRPTVRALCEQLRRRAAFPAEAWGEASRVELAEFTGKLIAREIGWPNGYFLPDDPIEIALYAPDGDGGEFLSVLYQLEKTTGRRLHGLRARTIGEFVDEFLKDAKVGTAGRA